MNAVRRIVISWNILGEAGVRGSNPRRLIAGFVNEFKIRRKFTKETPVSFVQILVGLFEKIYKLEN